MLDYSLSFLSAGILIKYKIVTLPLDLSTLTEEERALRERKKESHMYVEEEELDEEEEEFRGQVQLAVLPGSWIYPQTVDFCSSFFSMDGRRLKQLFRGFLTYILIT